MGKKNKNPFKTHEISVSKVPRVAQEPSSNNAQPAWRLSLVQMVAPWGWQDVTREKITEIREKLSHFESMTWNQILIDAKKQNHKIPVEKLNKRAQDRLIEIRQDDVDELISLHLSGKERVWGIRENEVLKIIWWDSHHEICSSLKKHT